jgi:outer membrane immunogenic protein
VLSPFRRLPWPPRLCAGRRHPRSPNRTFSGPRVGAVLGYDISRSGSSVDNDNYARPEAVDPAACSMGEIGFDVPVGTNLVVGVEGEATGSTAKWTNTFEPNTFNLGRVSAGRDLYVGARVGCSCRPRHALCEGRLHQHALQVAGQRRHHLEDYRLTTDGYRVGGGLEYAFSPKTFGKIEYRYSNYSRANFNFNGNTSDRFDIDTDRHQIVATYGLRF